MAMECCMGEKFIQSFGRRTIRKVATRSQGVLRRLLK
jgi:hypothetical protein